MRNLPITMREVVSHYDDGKNNWKLGEETGRTVYGHMDIANIPFVDNAEGRELRNKVYQAIYLAADYFASQGLYLGGRKVCKGKPKVYYIARDVDDLIAFDTRLVSKQRQLTSKRASSRQLLQHELWKMKDQVLKNMLAEQIAKQ